MTEKLCIAPVSVSDYHPNKVNWPFWWSISSSAYRLRRRILTWLSHLSTRTKAESIREIMTRRVTCVAAVICEGLWENKYDADAGNDDGCDDRKTREHHANVANKMKTIRVIVVLDCDSFSHSTIPPAPKSQGTSQKRRWKDSKSQRIRGFVLRLSFLVMSDASPIKSHHHDMIWTRTALQTKQGRQEKSTWGLNPTQRMTGH